MKMKPSNVALLRNGHTHAVASERWPETDAVMHGYDLTRSVRLTHRQLEVLALLCEGLPTKLICRRLGIAAGTVKVHIRFILRKLGVGNRLQAVVTAHRCGLLAGLGAGPATESALADESAAGGGSSDASAPQRVAVAA